MSVKKTIIFAITLTILACLQANAVIETAVDYPSKIAPGKAKVFVFFDDYKLHNKVLELAFKTKGKSLKPISFKNKQNGAVFDLTDGSLFTITMKDGLQLTPDDFYMVTKPQVKKISSKYDSAILANRFPGRKIIVPLISQTGQIAIEWVLSPGQTHLNFL